MNTKSAAQHQWLKPKTVWMQGLWHWPVSPDLQVATSKPHTPGRCHHSKGGSSPVTSLKQRKLPQLAQGNSPNPRFIIMHFQTNACGLRLSKSGSGAEEVQYKMLVSRSKPWGQYKNLELTITKDRQSSLWYTDVSFHLIPVHKIMPNTFKKCSQAFLSFVPFHMGLILGCSAQAEIFHHKREYMEFFYLLSLKGVLAKY